jgi:prophage maintenance system killer protein
MARLFDRDRTVIVQHIRNIYQTKELDRTSTGAKNAQVAADGKVRLMDLYNLDMIISVGYRVNSKRGTQFRIWATRDLYPTLEEKAAHLLYFLVKNHPFVDGNKRIAATLFLWFLQKNAALYRSDGTKRIADNALVAMTLLIAESQPQEKDLLTRVLVHLIHPEKS